MSKTYVSIVFTNIDGHKQLISWNFLKDQTILSRVGPYIYVVIDW